MPPNLSNKQKLQLLRPRRQVNGQQQEFKRDLEQLKKWRQKNEAYARNIRRLQQRIQLTQIIMQNMQMDVQAHSRLADTSMIRHVARERLNQNREGRIQSRVSGTLRLTVLQSMIGGFRGLPEGEPVSQQESRRSDLNVQEQCNCLFCQIFRRNEEEYTRVTQRAQQNEKQQQKQQEKTQEKKQQNIQQKQEQEQETEVQMKESTISLTKFEKKRLFQSSQKEQSSCKCSQCRNIQNQFQCDCSYCKGLQSDQYSLSECSCSQCKPGSSSQCDIHHDTFAYQTSAQETGLRPSLMQNFSQNINIRQINPQQARTQQVRPLGRIPSSTEDFIMSLNIFSLFSNNGLLGSIMQNQLRNNRQANEIPRESSQQNNTYTIRISSNGISIGRTINLNGQRQQQREVEQRSTITTESSQQSSNYEYIDFMNDHMRQHVQISEMDCKILKQIDDAKSQCSQKKRFKDCRCQKCRQVKNIPDSDREVDSIHQSPTVPVRMQMSQHRSYNDQNRNRQNDSESDIQSQESRRYYSQRKGSETGDFKKKEQNRE